jgi:imidazolonepropionase-like amidohydrolase
MRTVIKMDRIFDGTGQMIAPGALVIEGRKIAGAFKGEVPETLRDGAEIRELPGTALPGFVNTHDHVTLQRTWGPFERRMELRPELHLLRAVGNGMQMLAKGITTLRDLGGLASNTFLYRRAVADGLITGPRVVTCGQPISITGGHGWLVSIEADGADAVRAAARRIIKEGADWIKVMASGGVIGGTENATQMTTEELRAAFEEADRAGKPACAHAHSANSIKQCVEAGVTSIEHAMFLTDELAELMAKRGVWLSATMSESDAMARTGTAAGRPQWIVDLAHHHLDLHKRAFQKAVRAGVKLTVGTDPIGDIVTEMVLMTQCGVKTEEALLAGTRNGAEVLGFGDTLGTLTEGKLADVVVVDGNPLTDLESLRRVRLVIKEGTFHDPAVLSAYAGVPMWVPEELAH